MPSTHVNANKENVVVVVVVVVVIWLKRRVPILSVAIMSGAWAPTVSFSPPPHPSPPPWPVGVGSLRDSAPSDCEGDWGTQRLLSVCSKEEIALFLRRQKSKYFWNPFHSSGFLLLTYVNGFTKVLCFSQFINNGILQRSLIADKGLHWSTKKSQKKDQAFPRSSKWSTALELSTGPIRVKLTVSGEG